MRLTQYLIEAKELLKESGWIDRDGDGIPDQVEVANGLNPLLAADASGDVVVEILI